MTVRLAPERLKHQRANGARRAVIEQNEQQPLNINIKGQESPETEPAHARPLIYVASLADYVAGHLTGQWIDAGRDPSEVHEDVQAMLATSISPAAEEWAIHDYEGFGAWRPDEYENLDAVCRVASAIEEKGIAVTDWLAYVGETTDEAVANFDEAYRGNWPSLTDYIDDLVDESGLKIEVEPASLARYVDINREQMARDLEIDMLIVDQANGSVAVFDPGAAR